MAHRPRAAAISRSDDLRRQNKRRILEALRAHRTLSRTELAKTTGLSASTVTAATSELLATGHLIEANLPAGGAKIGSTATGRGRPRVALARQPNTATIAALTITLNRLHAELLDFAGDTISSISEQVDLSEIPRGEFAPRLAALVREAIAAAPARIGPLSAVAVGLQGVVDAGGSRIIWSPLSAHRDIALADELERALGAEVVLANDACMIATALHHADPRHYGDNFAAILLSYGVGMGMYLQGELFRGARTSAAEFGHIQHTAGGALCRCGRSGCVEAYASEYGIWRSAAGGDPDHMPATLPDQEMFAQLADRAKRGEAQAVTAYRLAGEALGRALLGVFAMFDPMPIAFVGSGTLAFDVLEPYIRDALEGPSTSQPYADTQMSCHGDNFELMRKGTIITALSNLDRRIDIDRAFG